MAKAEEHTVTEEPTQVGGEAGQEATTEETDKTFTKADLDRAVNTAVQSASVQQQRKLDDAIASIELKEAQAKQAQLEEAGKHKELYHSARAEIDALNAKSKATQFRMDAQDALHEMGLADHDSLIGNAETIENVIARAEQYQRDVAKGIEHGVRDRLDTGTGHVPKQNTDTKDKPHDQKTPEEFKAWKKEKGLV